MQRIAISTLAQFEALRERWDELYGADTTATLFLSSAWLSAYVSAAPYPWTILTLQDDDDALVAALPISIRRAPHPRLPVGRELTFAAQPIADYNGMLARPGREADAVRELAAWLGSMRWDRARFEDAEDSRVAALFAALGPDARRTVGSPEVCYYIDLPATFEEFLARLSTPTRRATLRGGKRIAQLLPTARITRAVDGDAAAHIDAVLAVNRTRWGGSGIRERRFRRLLQAAYDAGCARFHVVWDGARPIAGAASFVDASRGTYASWLLSHDPAYGKLSPGRALLATVVGEAIAEGFATFDFLRGDDAYKKSYATGHRTNTTFTVDRSGPRALLLRGAQPLYRWVRAAAVAAIVRPKRAARVREG